MIFSTKIFGVDSPHVLHFHSVAAAAITVGEIPPSKCKSSGTEDNEALGKSKPSSLIPSPSLNELHFLHKMALE